MLKCSRVSQELDERTCGGLQPMVVEKLYDATPNEPFKKADVKLADIAFKDSLLRRGSLFGEDQGTTHRVSDIIVSPQPRTR